MSLVMSLIIHFLYNIIRMRDCNYESLVLYLWLVNFDLDLSCIIIKSYSYRAKRGLYSGRSSFCTVSLRASKTSFLLARGSPAPSPAPRMSNKVTYFHED